MSKKIPILEKATDFDAAVAMALHYCDCCGAQLTAGYVNKSSHSVNVSENDQRFRVAMNYIYVGPVSKDPDAETVSMSIPPMMGTMQTEICGICAEKLLAKATTKIAAKLPG